MSLFDRKKINPMLIGASGAPFDDDKYLYEFKWDGERCIAYLDPKNGITELRNKRNVKMLSKVPELKHLHKQVNKKCILDGELLVIKNGKPNFAEIQKRSLMSNPFKIELASKKYPASFIAFDILQLGEEELLLKPLFQRKEYLEKVVNSSSPRMAVSKVYEGPGTALYKLAVEQSLEGIVAKRKDSIYIQGKRTRDWIKIKNLIDEDFVICGYIFKDNHMISIVLGQYSGKELVYKGHVTLGVGGEAFKVISSIDKIRNHPFSGAIPEGNDNAIWIKPDLVCTVKYMERTAKGGMRQPVFKGLRNDKTPVECQLEQGNV